MRLPRTLCALALFLCAFTPAAHANSFVWQDPGTGVSFTFPDTWRSINNQKPDDRVTIIGPSQQDRPICRLRVRNDGRFTYYPAAYSGDVQKVAYNNAFFEDYFGEYNNAEIQEYHDDAGLGRAFAGHAVANYTDATPPGKRIRVGEVWAGVYFDKAYILDCSATRDSFARWQPDFTSIAQSVDMREVMSPNPGGYYPRNVLRPGYNYYRQVRGPDTTAGQHYND